MFPVCPCCIWLFVPFLHFDLRFLYFVNHLCSTFVETLRSYFFLLRKTCVCWLLFTPILHWWWTHKYCIVANNLTTIHLTLCSCKLYLSQVKYGTFWVMFLNKEWKQIAAYQSVGHYDKCSIGNIICCLIIWFVDTGGEMTCLHLLLKLCFTTVDTQHAGVRVPK